MPEPTDPRTARVTAVYVISVAAELAGVHPQTLRIYERKGLLEPARTGGGRRRHSRTGPHPVKGVAPPPEAGLQLLGGGEGEGNQGERGRPAPGPRAGRG